MDARWLLALGFAILVGANLWNVSMTLEISPSSLFWPIVITGFAFPLVFVPLSGIALGTLRQDQIGNACGIYNLLRNLGGSIGIAVANTITQRHLQTHRNEIVRSLSGASLALRQQLAHLTMLMRLHAGPGKANLRAAALIQRTLDNQAQLWAYVDVFRYLALVSLVSVPMAFALRKAHTKVAAE